MIIGLTSLVGCYPGSDRTLNNTNLVYTVFDDGFDFSARKTYFLRNEVLAIDSTQTIPNSTQNAILSNIESQMSAKGWTRVFDVDNNGIPTDSAAVVVLSSALTNTIDGVSYYPGYGGWYGGWWGYPGGWPGYGWGGGVAIPYSYDLGTVYIDMLDRASYDPDKEQVNLVWTAAMNGVLSSSGLDTSNRLSQVIAQAYTQSPYL